MSNATAAKRTPAARAKDRASKEAPLSSADGRVRNGAVRRRTEKPRCAWPSSAISIDYHDREWGVPLKDDRKLFEFLVLDAAQAGLSWEIILRKREGFRTAFDNFDPEKIVRYDERKIKDLLANPGIIRNRLKIESAVRNARAFLQVQQDCGSFANYIWQFVDGRPKINACRSMKDVPATSPESDAMSKALKKRGFCFVGSTICYAFMQAAGMVNDHFVDCFRHAELTRRMQRWRIGVSDIE
jgi:DNA-3-methyladenine glycosylase I